MQHVRQLIKVSLNCEFTVIQLVVLPSFCPGLSSGFGESADDLILGLFGLRGSEHSAIADLAIFKIILGEPTVSTDSPSLLGDPRDFPSRGINKLDDLQVKFGISQLMVGISICGGSFSRSSRIEILGTLSDTRVIFSSGFGSLSVGTTGSIGVSRLATVKSPDGITGESKTMTKK